VRQEYIVLSVILYMTWLSISALCGSYSDVLPHRAFGNENEVNTCVELQKVLTVLGSFDYEPRDLRKLQEELPR